MKEFEKHIMEILRLAEEMADINSALVKQNELLRKRGDILARCGLALIITTLLSLILLTF